MAKRFTDTGKWKKGFIRGLDAPCKLLWMYLCDACDHAGIWEVFPEMAELETGQKYNWIDITDNIFSDKIVVFDDGKKWFIPSFIEFQYGILNPENRAHKSVITLLLKYKLISDDKGLIRPLQGCKDKDKDKDMVMVKDKEKSKREEIKEKTDSWVEMILQDEEFVNVQLKNQQLKRDHFDKLLFRFVEDKIALEQDWPSFKDFRQNFTFWIKTGKELIPQAVKKKRRVVL